jgi:acetyl-CoA C-acetyltransferase
VTEAAIVSTARTGLGKSWKGAFNMTYGATLGAHSVQHAVARAGIDPAEVEDVIMGSTFGEGTTGGNIARQIALRAGLPITTAGLSINRFCSSGLQSIALAAQRVMTEGAEVIVAGGLESISCVQNETNMHMRRDPWIDEHKPTLFWSMLQTRKRWPSATTFPRRRRTSTACAANCVRPPDRPPASSKMKSRP